MLGALFVSSGVQAAARPDRLAPMAKPVTDLVAPWLRRLDSRLPADERTLVRVNGTVQAVGGLLMVTRWHRPAAALLAGSMVPTTLAGHRFWAESDPGTRRRERIQLGKNLSILGGLLLAAMDTEGRPGLRHRLTQFMRGRPGLTWRARQFTFGEPGLTARTRQVAVGEPGITWRAGHLAGAGSDAARRARRTARKQTRRLARSGPRVTRGVRQFTVAGPARRLSR